MRNTAREIVVHTKSDTPTRDEAGDYVYTWAQRTVQVYGIAPAASTEPGDANRSAVVTGWDVYAPPGVRIGPHDRVQLPHLPADQLCEVDGEPAIWDHNPHGTLLGNVGVVIKLKRVNG